ncbi:unnamed protein product [Ilex paraguariensis]|uniref:Uncharacterized protein n=1 Tax=Ilex paraguariensis TaxID=185542 RepID=A0ABC8R1Z2_9AQUA
MVYTSNVYSSSGQLLSSHQTKFCETFQPCWPWLLYIHLTIFKCTGDKNFVQSVGHKGTEVGVQFLDIAYGLVPESGDVHSCLGLLVPGRLGLAASHEEDRCR